MPQACGTAATRAQATRGRAGRPSSLSPASAGISAPTSPRGWPPTPRSSGSSASTRAAAGRAGRLSAGVELHESHLRTGELHPALRHRRRRRRWRTSPSPPRPDPQRGGRAAMKESNVIGTMQLLAACQQAPGLRKLVVRSSTAAYGASFRDPAVFTEDTEPRECRAAASPATSSTSRATCAGSAGAGRDVAATVLRFAPFIGPAGRHPAVPVLLDAGRADRASAATRGCSSCTSTTRWRCCTGRSSSDHPGTFNVAGRGVLDAQPGDPPGRPGRRAHRWSRACPGSRRSRSASGMLDFSLDQLDLFVHGRVVDNTRAGRRVRLRAAHHRGGVRRVRPGPAARPAAPAAAAGGGEADPGTDPPGPGRAGRSAM